jgi:hypothetical protein
VIFTRNQVATLAGGCVESLAAIRALIVTRQRRLDGGDVAAWGQYVDELRWRSGQWGLLGTSASVQTLAICDGGVPNNDSRSVIAASRPLLPADLSHTHTLLEPKRAKGDFEDLMRLTFVAESHALGERVSSAQRPPIVSHILESAKGRHYWDADSTVTNSSPGAGNAFMTALVLHGLRQFEDPPGEFQDFRRWLAEQLASDPLVRSRPHLVALIGLALQSVHDDPARPQVIVDGLHKCEEQLLRWRTEEYTLVVDRPAFEGYSLPHGTNYTFVNAEIVSALFFLRQGSPRTARRFVLQVADRVHENIQTHSAFQGQPGMQPTVDQLWAARLLGTVVETHKQPGNVLVPRFGSWPWARTGALVAALIVGLVITLLTQDPETGGGTFLVTVVLSFAFGYFFTQS